MKTVLVTGAKGQLGVCLNDITLESSGNRFLFTDFQELDITNLSDVQEYFSKNNINYCVNCAAFTAVDVAELESVKSQKANAEGPKNLALACKQFDAILIHISTDFVFDGENTSPYLELDSTNPVSVYGQTKLDGEKAIQEKAEKYFIIRTSWLYSEHCNNFMKTMLRLGSERAELSVVNDQIGTPTYAKDLAKVILKIIKSDSNDYGIYHYSNDGVASWYDFADEIFKIEKNSILIKGIPTSAYLTSAKRPKYSVLDKSKIKEMLNIDIPTWKESLKKALVAYHKL